MIDIQEAWGQIAPPPRCLLNDFGDNARANRPAAFPNGEVAPDVEGHRLVQANDHGGVVTWHDHCDPIRQLHFAGDVRGPEKELRLVPAEERRVPTAFVL